jgi:hypothetical protein
MGCGAATGSRGDSTVPAPAELVVAARGSEITADVTHHFVTAELFAKVLATDEDRQLPSLVPAATVATSCPTVTVASGATNKACRVYCRRVVNV